MDNKIPHILIVDDDVNLLSTMRDILKMKGYEPVIAPTGTEALALLEGHTFDLALIDLRLGDMSGLKVLSAIKARSPETECILLTGHASQNSAIEAIQLGIYGYFQKPFEMEQFLLSVQRALEKITTEQALRESERFAHATVDALSSHLAILDETGAILAVNRAWREFAKANSAGNSDLKLCEGANYLSVCDTAKGKNSEEASAMAAGIRTVMSGKQDEFLLEYPCHSPEEKRWFIARVTRFPGEGALRIVVAHENITERKQAEEKIAQTEKRFRSLIENAPDGVVLVGLDGKYKYASPAALRVFNYSMEDGLDSNPAEQTHPEDLPMVLGVLQDIIENPSKVPTIQYRFMHKDGSWRWVESTFTNLLAEPSVEAIVINFRDITERKLAEENLRKSEALFASLFHANPTRISITRFEDSRFIDVNETFLKSVGYTREEVVGHTSSELNDWVDPQERIRLRNLLKDHGRVKDFETQLRKKSGEIMDILISAELIELFDQTCILSVGLDITERKQAEEKIRVLSRAVEQSPASIVITDLHGNIEYVNPKFSEVTGYSLEEAIGENPNILKSGITTEAEYKILWDTITSGNVWRGEFLNKKKNGETYWENATIAPVFNDAGEITNFLAVKEDITQRKLAEESLRQAEANYHSIFENALEGIFQSLPQGRFITVNPAFARMLGYESPNELVETITDIASQVYVESPRRTEFMQKLAKQETVTRFEYQMKRKDGGIIWVSESVRSVYDDKGGLRYYEGSAEDITERKQANEALLESEKRYRTIFDGVQDAIFVETKNGRILEVNNSACEMYGYKRHEFLTKTVSEFVLEGSTVFAPHLNLNKSSAPIETINRRANGEIFPIEISGGVQVINGEEVLLAIVRDITQRKKDEEALRASEQKYRLLFDEMLSGIAVHEIICDGQGKPIDYRFLAINPAFEKMTGLVSAAVIGKTVLEVMPATEELWIENYGRVALTRIPTQFENYSSELGKYFEVRAFSPEKGKFATIFNDITERKQAELALQESEALYRQAIEVAGAVPYLQSYTGEGTSIHYDFIGEGIRQITGYEAGEFNAALWDKFTEESILLGDLESYSMEEAIQRVRSGEIPLWKCEHRIRARNGKIHWVFEAAVELYAENGTAKGSIGMFQDITERKKAEEALQESEERFRVIFEKANDAIHIEDADDKILAVNSRMCKLMGYSREELLKMRVADLQAPERRQLGGVLKEEFARHNNTVFEALNLHHDGRRIPVEISIGLIERPSGNMYISVVRDITERKQAERNIRQRVKELELLYQSGLVFSQLLNPKEIAQKIIDLLGEKMNWHHTTIRLLRTQDELELVAFDQPGLEDKTAIEARFNNLITHVGQGLSGWALQQSKTVRLGDVNSDPHYVATFPGLHSGLYVPLKSGDHVLGVISIESEQPNAFSDADEQLLTTLANQAANAFENAHLYQTAQQEIIERKRVENLLADERNQLATRVEERTSDLSRVNAELAHAVQVKDEFLASMSHELRTPLTGILGLSEVLQLKVYGELNEKQSTTLKTIEESGRHLLELINDILDLSKIEAGMLELQFAPCSLTDICMASLQLIKGMAQHKSQHVHYSPPPELIVIRADARRLKQLLVNLLSNAIKFTPENGDLGLDVQAIESERKIKLTVWDKGIGIKADNLQSIFNPFVQLDSGLTREYPGTGLGLSLVQHLTELHNGGIEVESKLGGGSRFTVILPWSPQDTTPIPYIQHHDTGSLVMPAKHFRAPLVMILDDNEMVLQMIADFLESKKYRVMKVRNGIELLERAAESHPNIMLVDIQMPGIGGLETIRRIRSHPDPLVAATPVIAVTALAMPADREHCLRAGANDYMSKPVKLKALAASIQKLLEIKK